MRLLYFLFFTSTVLSAQSNFLNNPNIVWAAEIEQDWVIDFPSLENEYDEGIITLKMLCTDPNAIYPEPPSLGKLVWQSMISGQLPIFEDAACTAPMDLHRFLILSDGLNFDPEASDADQPMYFDLELYGDFKAWRLRQILSYQQKSGTWATTVESIAPLIEVKNSQGDSIGTRPIFWFRPDNTRRKLTSGHIIWAKKTINKTSKTQLRLLPIKPLKCSPGFSGLLPAIRELVTHKMSIPLYHGAENRLLTPEERRILISGKDTVSHLDGEGSELLEYDYLDQIHQLRLVQTWYWDRNLQRLSICLDAVAPMVDVVDQEGNFRYSRPLFYRRVRH